MTKKYDIVDCKVIPDLFIYQFWLVQFDWLIIFDELNLISWARLFFLLHKWRGLSIWQSMRKFMLKATWNAITPFQWLHTLFLFMHDPSKFFNRTRPRYRKNEFLHSVSFFFCGSPKRLDEASKLIHSMMFIFLASNYM